MKLSETHQQPRRRGDGLRRVIRILRSILTAYLVVVLMFYFMQRSMIYFPTREAPIQPGEVGFSHGQVHTVTSRADDDLELHGWYVLSDGRIAQDRD